MRILSLIPDVTKIVHEVDGKLVEFEADAHGAFDVPDTVGQALTAFPHWARDLGQAAEKVAHEIDDDVHAALAEAKAKIAELEAELTKKAAPAKAAAAKKAAGSDTAPPAAAGKDSAPSA